MKYTSSIGKPLLSFKDWENLFLDNPKKKKHWREDRSAYSLANFMINENGKEFVTKIISELIGENLILEKAIPELETRFDKYKNGREHDLGIWGTTDSGKSVFVGVEAKVDEKFNCKISEAYVRAKTSEINGKKTNATKRIEEILNRSFKIVTKKHWDLMYQLFYTLFGTFDAKNCGEKADIPVSFFIVFKTSSYKEVYGKRNYNDYISFLDQFKATKVKSNRENIDIHIIRIEGKNLYSIYCQP